MYAQINDGIYPDVKAIVSGIFEPKDPTRCLVCGKDLRTTKSRESTCGRRCFRRMCEIQRNTSEATLKRWLRDHSQA